MDDFVRRGAQQNCHNWCPIHTNSFHHIWGYIVATVNRRLCISNEILTRCFVLRLTPFILRLWIWHLFVWPSISLRLFLICIISFSGREGGCTDKKNMKKIKNNKKSAFDWKSAAKFLSKGICNNISQYDLYFVIFAEQGFLCRAESYKGGRRKDGNWRQCVSMVLRLF